MNANSVKRIFRLLVFVSILIFVSGFVNAQQTKDTDILKIISKLETGEKIDLLCAKAPAVQRLDIPSYDWWNECLHGVARNGKATVFPKPIAMGSMWDVDLMKRIANVISDEARAKYYEALDKKGVTGRYEGLTYFSPTLNIARDPRWGRMSECFSEDPLLTSEMGVAFVQGLQGDDPYYLKLVATPKHFVANNEENRRVDGSAEVDEMSLREYYFPAFKAAVMRGKATSVMGAYNALNGVPCCANEFLLTDVLRKEWGFEGVVMSDGSAIGNISNKHKYKANGAEGAAAALQAGCDMALRDEYGKALRQALNRGLIEEKDIDIALNRVLTLRKRLGILTSSAAKTPYERPNNNIVECEAHRQLAYEAACKSIVLLKNENVLPLNAEKLKTVALIGDAFKKVYYGDYSGRSEQNTTLLDALIEGYQDKIKFLWAGDGNENVVVPEANLVRPAKYEYEGKLGLTGYYYNRPKIEGKPIFEQHDLTLDFKAVDSEKLRRFGKLSAYWTSSLVPGETGEHILSLEGTGDMKLYIDKKLVIDRPGNRGKVSAAISLVANKSYEIRIECENMNKKDKFRFLWCPPVDVSTAAPEKMARDADVAIVFIRDNSGAEGRDRTSLAMNPEQISMVKRISQANKNTIVLFGSSAPLMLGEIVPYAKALLNVWIGGQGEAQAISDILFGKVNPSGKTPVTFYADEKQLPPLDDYNVKNGRSYQYFNGDILFPFGYGLSYTKYRYSPPQLQKKQIGRKGTIKLSIMIKNEGAYDGDEVVQCYVSSDKWNGEQLKQKLLDFTRVHLKKGETKMVTFDIPVEKLQRWNVIKHCWEIQPGQYRLSVVPNSQSKNVVDFSIK
ncbi:beta-glucosidase [Bacteroides sp. 1001136B_160425_E2]|uniref:beta-glucosidase n=1 Tax=Bacteroides sp. 1001136B_160425_E2 TaxID=2787083 RepID=UPI0018A020A5|nr:glycoside hydrolase family 3 N-terminal domain-containing protein [Bacteroides sp. 1001136B_160425_E2]